MEFEWDEDKNKWNIQERNISFVYAIRIFSGSVFEQESTRQDYGEIRIKAIGKVDDIVLCVVYTLRGEKRRIISVRKASRRERQIYHAS
ncbi:MAG: uncharacterized DUF497 family protein [Candidatus Latescibacterota bacterium]|jgi:uncharacterized DUF497 family protein